MKIDPGTEFITLSDSLPSPIPKPPHLQGKTKVVCLDSDTESDGSYAHVCDNKRKSVDKRSMFSFASCHSPNPKFEENAEIAHGHDHSRILDTSTSHSSSFELEDYKHFERNHSSEGIKDVRRCSIEGIKDFQNVSSPQHQSGCASFITITTPSTSLCEVKSCSLELKSNHGQNHTHLDIRDRVCLEIKDIENNTKVAYEACLSLHSDGSDGSLSGWNDQLKEMMRKTERSKLNDVNVEDLYENKSNTSDQDSILKKKLYESTRQKERDRELSDSGDSVSCKRPKKSNIRTNLIEKESEKQKKGERRVKDKDMAEARKQKLKEEREILQREKQEEKRRQQEAKRQKNEEERKRKEELRAEATERRKMEKEKGKWEKGKFALQNITAFVDTQILEGGLVGGHLLTRFAEKGFKYHLVQNPVKKTVTWKMQFPSDDPLLNSQGDSQFQESQEVESSNISRPQLLLKSTPISYVLVVLEAEEFVDMINKHALDKHIKSLQDIYPGFTLCYLINKLMRYLHKREQQQYKNPENSWTRPPVEQILAKLITSYNGVHSRLCLDEAEVAEHIVGLTRSLAECPFKRKLSALSLSANGDHVVKNDPNNNVIKKNLWMKALVALPKVSGACAIAIARKYPSMNALFEAYLDPSRTVHEKEFLLQDLMKEGLLGAESNRRVGPACSRRVYRIMMAQQGNLHTDDVEEGADLFED